MGYDILTAKNALVLKCIASSSNSKVFSQNITLL